MALIDCPECGRNVSTMANSCPNCGYPIKINTASSQDFNKEAIIKMMVSFCDTVYDKKAEGYSKELMMLLLESNKEILESPVGLAARTGAETVINFVYSIDLPKNITSVLLRDKLKAELKGI